MVSGPKLTRVNNQRASSRTRGRSSRGRRSADLGVQRDLDVLLVAVAHHREGERLAGLVGADRDDQGDAVGDLLALEGDDDVALLEAGVLGGRVRRGPRRSRRRSRRAGRSAPWRRSPGSAPRRCAGSGRRSPLTCSIGIAKPTPMLPAWSSPVMPPVVAMAELTPTTWPSRLTSGPPELPGLIAASVWTALMYDDSLGRVAGGDRSLQRADDAGGHRGREAERRTDRDDGVADAQRLGLAQGGGLHVLGLVAVEHREVVDRAAARRRWLRSGCRPGRRSRSGRRPRRPARPRGCW